MTDTTADRGAAPAARPERDVANDMIGLYDRTRAAATELLAEYAFATTDAEHDPEYGAHRWSLRELIRVCEEASDGLIADYGG